MKFTIPGKDVIRIVDNDFETNKIVKSDDKIHLIKFCFTEPCLVEKIDWVLKSYPNTNRFIVYDHIKAYNQCLKKTNKKYYIENTERSSLISFFKKNNKVLLNFFKLNDATTKFLLDSCFKDVLYNTEVIYIPKYIYDLKKNEIDQWRGNVIINNDYVL